MQAIEDRVGEFIYSTHGREMHEVCAELLKASGLKLAVAESCTGGMIASRLISVPGSSEWFMEGAVTYSCDSKMRRLGVKAETLEKYTDVSAETAKEMADGIRLQSGSRHRYIHHRLRRTYGRARPDRTGIYRRFHGGRLQRI